MKQILSTTQAIAHFSQNFNHHVSQDLSHQVRRAIIDTIAVGLAAHQEPAAKIALRYAQSISATPTAEAWGTGLKLSAEACTLYNGIAAHVLDYDDVSSPLRGHPSIALLPPLLALAQTHQWKLSQVSAAYIVGFELMLKLARVMVQNHYAKGWHATTTLGTIASALACSHLSGHSVTETINSLGLAVAQAGGSRGNFGTMAKSFQTGQCGAAGLRASQLAGFGMDAGIDMLDGDQGFTRLYAEHESLDNIFSGLGQEPLELTTSGLEIKKYPMCYAAHRALDGMLALANDNQLDAQKIESIHVTANNRALVPLIHSHPETGLEAKFSMEFAMAAAVLDRQIRLSSYTDASVQRPEIQALMAKVTKSEDPGPMTPRWNRIDIRLRDGQLLSKTVTSLRGSMQNPLSDLELKQKWDDCLAFGEMTDSHHFFETVMDDADITVTDLMQRLPSHLPV